MADTKLSALAALTGANSASDDLLYIDDISVTTSKSITRAELAIGMNATQAEIDAGTVTNKLIPPSLRKVSLLATQATTSGTEKDFTIPAGARQIILSLIGASTNGTSRLQIQLGDSGGIETSGYLSGFTASTTFVEGTSGYLLNDSVAASTNHGSVILTLIDAATFTWSSNGTIYQTSAGVYSSAGSKSLSAALTTVRITTVNGTDAFDAGLVGCAYIL